MSTPTRNLSRTTMELPASLRTQLLSLARARHPHEACGLLLGRREGTAVRIARAREVRNLNTTRAHDRYELDPVEHLEAEDEARAAGLDVVGVWHSHPDHPAVPSEIDRAQAWEGWSYVIVSVARDGASELRSWRLAGERFVEEEVLP